MIESLKRKEEKEKNFRDIYDGIKPARIPIHIQVAHEAAIEYCQLDLKKTQWDIGAYPSYLEPVCNELIDADGFPISMNVRIAAMYQMLDAKSFVMSSSGVLQHPETHSMEQDEYDEFIADPYAFMLEKAVPRIYRGLDGNPHQAALNLTKAFAAFEDYKKAQLMTMGKLSAQCGFANYPTGGVTEAPYDFVADLLRSFSGISLDIRRCPEKIAEACEAILPYMKKCAVSKMSSNYGRTMIPIHMPAFMNTKQFEKYWWPSFYKLIEYIVESGSNCWLLLQGDMMRYIEYLNELPGRQEIRHEAGDMKDVVERTSTKHIISGIYPVTMLQTATKTECIDYAKTIIDVMGVNGNYIFNFDKPILSFTGNTMENLQAVLKTVREYGKY
ncbi:uroporphyrinogen decarboxylase family protein [Acetobacterium wieringae]|uniref:Uroporphyrinogen decarboxylase n=1 Tax=Acetobacterium wieringae TaxID=52694 RepID=A0A5D0WHU4_9FIRM|nr:uroporphyrinogen decarboxylase family protein [Acetobacterium wieringae]MEA4806761.1 uroporphyrinogen decarboxylase family protein [Acetobacterium wieringae]TYC83633.1 uroporphyrinogen decarboxylase [Acetobacterium wieringae]